MSETFKPNDEVEQAFRAGYIKGKGIDERLAMIADHYGFIQQTDIMIEECAELIQAICKLRRGYSRERYYSVKEELADVQVIAEQLRIMLGCDDIDKIKEEKINRQLQRMEDEKNVEQ